MHQLKTKGVYMDFKKVGAVYNFGFIFHLGMRRINCKSGSFFSEGFHFYDVKFDGHAHEVE